LKTLIFGNGFLGKQIADYLGAELSSARITRPEDIEASIAQNPEIIINAVAKTGRPNVDWCEDHKEETYFANVEVPKMLAAYADREGIRIVQFSSGCIYGGDNGGSGFAEDDQPNFERSYYSHTKAEAERALAKYDNILTLRPRMPLSAVPSDRNLINKLLSYKSVIEIPNSVTIIEELLPALKGLIEGGYTGTFNMINPEPVTHKEILELYEQYSGKSLGKTYIPASELKVKAPRSNTILSMNKLNSLGLEGFHPTKESLARILKRYVELERQGVEKTD
jgi:dTDP-4-dehydrorhamnose reductase